MFNTQEPVKTKLLSGTEKIVTCTYPTDEQWISLHARKRSIMRKGGRADMDWDDLGNHRQFDLEMLGEIALDGSADHIDEFEAAKIVERLSYSLVLTVDRSDAQGFSVEMEVFSGAIVKHILRMPTERQMAEYEKTIGVKKVTPKGTIFEMALQQATGLWAALDGVAEGYAPGSEIPIVHKTRALRAVIDFLRDQERYTPES